MSTSYDTIGINYAQLRKPDHRIQQLIDAALGDAKTVLNVGAGTGSYEPLNKSLTAIEPSVQMIRQREPGCATVIQGSAENLPLRNNSFDASMALLTVHHWTDKRKGLQEMRRVTKGAIVLLTIDPLFREFWLTDYFPELIDRDDKLLVALRQYEQWLGPVDVQTVPIPHDCTDGFLSAYWRRPASYLDARIRSAMSPFQALGDVTVGLNKLRSDLESGAWAVRYAGLQDLDSLDCGYRLVRTRS